MCACLDDTERIQWRKKLKITEMFVGGGQVEVVEKTGGTQKERSSTRPTGGGRN